MRELNALLIHPGFFEGLRHPGLLFGNQDVASGGDRCFSSMKRSGALDIPVSHSWIIILEPTCRLAAGHENRMFAACLQAGVVPILNNLSDAYTYSSKSNGLAQSGVQGAMP